MVADSIIKNLYPRKVFSHSLSNIRVGRKFQLFGIISAVDLIIKKTIQNTFAKSKKITTFFRNHLPAIKFIFKAKIQTPNENRSPNFPLSIQYKAIFPFHWVEIMTCKVSHDNKIILISDFSTRSINCLIRQ